MFVSEERDHWKEPSKYESPNMEWKDKMQSRAEGFFLKSRPLGKKKSRRDKVARVKEQRSVFIHSLIHLPAKPWLCDSTCRRSFAVLDSVQIRDQRAIIAVATAIHNFCSTL